ncbi:metallophosphoesterase family protein [bacterium]|jgi:putative phosphoesterase|nr:metallophosphoesterase family protein [bacterium]
MKIALISDIHANSFYLKSVIDSIKNQQIDRVICLGDLVGYYENPNEVINLCIKNNIECILGNHDQYLLGTLKYKEEKEGIYKIKEHRKVLSSSNMNFINGLPHEITIHFDGKIIYCTHATPHNTTEYLYNPNKIEYEHIQGYDYYCSGHTHIPYIQYKQGTCIVNPGSVGQPRDYTILPSYAVIDLNKDEVSIKKIKVDVEMYLVNLASINYNPDLIDILTRKK